MDKARLKIGLDLVQLTHLEDVGQTRGPELLPLVCPRGGGSSRAREADLRQFAEVMTGVALVNGGLC